MKRITSLILAVLLLAAAAIPASATQTETLEPRLINTSQASIPFVITAEGIAHWSITCIGKSSALAIDSVSYLEYFDGYTWERVDIGKPNDEYVYNVDVPRLMKNYTYALPTPGTYRAVVIFTVYGVEQDEVLTLWNDNEFYS